jgi:hypothetical protein
MTIIFTSSLAILLLLTFSDAVAILVPGELKAIAARGLSWADIIVTARCKV